MTKQTKTEQQESAGIGTISSPQKKAINAILSSKSITDAAKASGIGERTIFTWLDTPAFRRALREAEAKLFEAIVRSLAAGQTKALNTIEALMKNAKSEAIRLQAAQSWIAAFMKFSSAKAVEDRLNALEGIDDKILVEDIEAVKIRRWSAVAEQLGRVVDKKTDVITVESPEVSDEDDYGSAE